MRKREGQEEKAEKDIYLSWYPQKDNKSREQKGRGKEKTAGQRKNDKQVKEGELKRYGERKRERE